MFNLNEVELCDFSTAVELQKYSPPNTPPSAIGQQTDSPAPHIMPLVEPVLLCQDAQAFFLVAN